MGAAGAPCVRRSSRPQRITVAGASEERLAAELVAPRVLGVRPRPGRGLQVGADPSNRGARSGARGPAVAGAVARVSDAPAEDSVPTFRFDDLEGIAAAVLHLAGLDRG